MSYKKTLFLLKLCCFFIFIGRAYQFIFWDAPYRSLLWDQQLFEPIVNGLFDMEWQEYANSMRVDSIINTAVFINGLLFLLAGIASLFIKRKTQRIFKILILIGGFLLVFLSFLLTKEKFYHYAMFFEHSIQFGAPFLLIHFLNHNNYKKLLFYLKILIALTFTCHGLYAIGMLYPIPATFVTMTINILPITDTQALDFLLLAGILDFIVAIAIFIPRIAKFALLYACIWGLLTAFARIIGNFIFDFPWQTLHQYTYQMVYRIPHGLIPLIAYLILKKEMLNTKDV